MDRGNKKYKNTKELIISLIAALVMFGAGMGVALWQRAATLSRVDEPMAVGTIIIVNALGALVMFGIVYHFIKKPKDDE